MKEKVLEELREVKTEIRRRSKHWLNKLEFPRVFRTRNGLGKLRCLGGLSSSLVTFVWAHANVIQRAQKKPLIFTHTLLGMQEWFCWKPVLFPTGKRRDAQACTWSWHTNSPAPVIFSHCSSNLLSIQAQILVVLIFQALESMFVYTFTEISAF